MDNETNGSENSELVGKRIKQVRQLLGMSQSEFSVLTNLGETTIRFYETGRNGVSNKAIGIIVGACQRQGMGISEHWMRSGKPRLRSADAAFVGFVKARGDR